MDLGVPRISVLVPAMRGFESVRAALASWEAQSSRDQLEVLVLCPDADCERKLPPGVRTMSTAGLELHEARARALREARGEYVMIAEDHCLPDADATAHLLDAVDEGWDIIAPALRSADPRTMAARSAFTIGYSEWMEPVRSGERQVLPGHNTLVRRSALLATGDDLEEHLRSAAFLARDLIAGGCRGYLDATARMRHFDSTSWLFHLRAFACVGLAFGALRTRSWPRIPRLLYVLATPAVVARHYARASRQLRRAPSYPRTRPGIALLAVTWGVCEGAGAIIGAGHIGRAIEITEIKPVTARDVARADAFVATQADAR